ncbi:MAG: SH3 domain-containing protein [Flexilinea sp.]|nr:SH3 domain-containing protein [Flexilinea sp.]
MMLICFGLVIPVISSGFFQIPTVDIPTVTGTDRGVVVRVKNDDSNPQINVRSGPGTEYDRVGTLVSNQEVVGKGRTEGGSWILIEYQGGPDGYAWVYSSYVDYVGDLPIVVVPNTPTPRITNTIDPTLAAQFIITVEPTRLPTFTEPAPLSIPTFDTVAGVNVTGGVPLGMIIVICGILGIIIGLFALSQRR